MKTRKKMAGCLIMAAGITNGSTNNSIAGDVNQGAPAICGSVSAGVVNENILISGKPQSEYPMQQYSASVSAGPMSLFGGVNQDEEDVRELDIGVSYQKVLVTTSFGKLSGMVAVERKEFPDQGKEMYVGDIVMGAHTRVGDISLRFRERFNTTDYDSGRTAVLSAATPPLNLGEIAGMDISLRGNISLAYQDEFVGTSSEWGYVAPGLILSLRKGNICIEAFLKDQRALRDDLDNHIYGGVRVTYSFGRRDRWKGGPR